MKSLGSIIALLFVFSGVVAWRLNETFANKAKSQSSMVSREGFNLRAQLSDANVSATTTAQRIHWLLEQVPRYQESKDAKAGMTGKFIIDPSPRQMNTQRAIETLTTAQVQPVFSQQPVTIQQPDEAPQSFSLAVDQTWWRDYMLTMVFHSSGAKRAVINGKFVVEGYSLGNGVSVYRISESSVFLHKAKTLFELKLNKYGNDGALTPITTK